MITITIEDPEKSGKSHAIAIFGKYLKCLGFVVFLDVI